MSSVQNANVEQVLNKFGLNWKVKQKPLVALTKKGKELKTPFNGIFRMDTKACLGSGTDRYTVSQNADTVELLFNFFGEDLSVKDFTSGGALKGGARMYLTLKNHNQKYFLEGDGALKSRIIIKDSHDGSCRITLGLQDYVKVCSNGMHAWNNKAKVHISHTKTLTSKLKQFAALYKEFEVFQDNHYKMYLDFQASKVTKKDMLSFVGKLNNVDFSLPEAEFIEKYSTRKYNIVKKQYDCILLETGRQGKNKFGLLQGITNYTSHEFNSNKTDEYRLESSIDGASQRLTAKAINLLQ